MMENGLFNFEQFVLDEQATNYVKGLTEVLDRDLAELPQRLQISPQFSAILRNSHLFRAEDKGIILAKCLIFFKKLKN